jgi:hypothetical protein
MSNDTSDLDRVEKLFNKALWAVGVLGAIAIGSGAAVVFSFNSQLSDTTSRAEGRTAEISREAQTRISEISETAEARIKEQAARVGTNLEERLMSDIDREGLIANAEESVRRDMLESGEVMKRLQEREAMVLDEIKTMKSDAQMQLGQVQQSVAAYSDSVDEARAALEQLISLQDVTSQMEVEIRDIKAPFQAIIGRRAVVTAEYIVSDVERKAKITFDVKFVCFGQSWTVQDTVLIPMKNYSDTTLVSKSFIVPERDEETGTGFGAGDYAIKVEIWFGETMLAQKSETWSVAVEAK